MAEVASDVVNFDIIDGIILDSGDNVLQNLTEDERMEVNNVVTLLESAQEDSLQHFDLDENTTCGTQHKNVSEEELDRLAGKNNAQVTSYQTKWASVVMKAKYYLLFD